MPRGSARSLLRLFHVSLLPDLCDLALLESFAGHQFKLQVFALIPTCPGESSRNPFSFRNPHVNDVLDTAFPTHVGVNLTRNPQLPTPYSLLRTP